MKTASPIPNRVNGLKHQELFRRHGPSRPRVPQRSSDQISATDTRPLNVLEAELKVLRQDLRKAARVYVARLEIGLAQSAAVIASYRDNGDLAADKLRHIRDLTILLRSRKLRAGQNGRKELNDIDTVINELHLATHHDCSMPQRR